MGRIIIPGRPERPPEQRATFDVQYDADRFGIKFAAPVLGLLLSPRAARSLMKALHAFLNQPNLKKEEGTCE